MLEQLLKMPAEERAELVEHLVDSLADEEVDIATELPELDEAIIEADRAVERKELIPADDVLTRLRQMS